MNDWVGVLLCGGGIIALLILVAVVSACMLSSRISQRDEARLRSIMEKGKHED